MNDAWHNVEQNHSFLLEDKLEPSTMIMTNVAFLIQVYIMVCKNDVVNQSIQYVLWKLYFSVRTYLSKYGCSFLNMDFLVASIPSTSSPRFYGRYVNS